jgi:phosphoglycerate dehydrogenase-like enzyme
MDHKHTTTDSNTSQPFFIIAHPESGLSPRLEATEEVLRNLNMQNILTINPDDYKKDDFFASIANKEKFTAAFVGFRLKRELELLLDNFPKIDWVQVLGTGVDTILTVNQIYKPEITLTNLRSTSAELLGEFAMAGSLYFAKRIREYEEFAEVKYWKENAISNIVALNGKNALVVGLGSIGGDIAIKCKLGFGMNVSAVKRELSKLDDKLAPLVDKVYCLDDLETAVKDADYIYVSLPSIKGKPMIFDSKIFKAMKKGAIFVNVGRGSYVDENALISALRDGTLAGAALDVFAQEPLSPESPFYTDEEIRRKVLNTCHTADHSTFLLEKTQRMIRENIELYVQGKQVKYVVDKVHGY